MEPTLTPEQQKQLDSWASKRDSILLEIANKTTESDQLTAKNKDLASSNTEIADKIQQSIGRLAELDKREEERATLLSVDVANLETKKSTLQTVVSSLESEVAVLIQSKGNLNEDIVSITKVHEAVFAQVGNIERIIGEVVKINSENAREIQNILVQAGNELKTIIEVAEKNVDVTNKAIVTIPKIIVDLHRDVIERRQFNKHKI